MPNPFPEVRVRRRNVPAHNDTALRNALTLHGAIVRGETEVVFHNANGLRQDMIDRVRPMIPRGHPPNRHWQWQFVPYRDPRESDYAERPAVRDVIPDEPWEGFELEWVKVLGEGGYGLATLWNVCYDDGSRERVVIKIPHQTDITGEAQWHLRYKRASHIVQFLDIQERARQVRRRHFPGVSFSWEQDFDWRAMNVVLLEFAEYGNVYEMMQKVSFFGIEFSNRCLWEIWECLVKGVASVAWQPHLLQIPESRDLLDRALNSYDDPRLSHYSDFLQVWPMTHDVHFDLEEQNILIADDEVHPHRPIFKLHDFGEYSHKMRECWRDWQEKDYWRCRKVPKRNRLAPETFTADWDEILMGSGVDGFTGEDFSWGHPVAGRYGTWTNIFHIAQIMQSIITKIYGFHPLNMALYTSQDGLQTDGTYGWRVMKPRYAHVELELKDLLLQCMFDQPSCRPSLDYLLKKIAARKARGFDETPRQVERFWQRLANLRRDTQAVAPSDDDDDDEDDDDEEGSPPSLSDGDSDYVPSHPPTPQDNNDNNNGGGGDGNNRENRTTRGTQRNRSGAPSPDTDDVEAGPADVNVATTRPQPPRQANARAAVREVYINAADRRPGAQMTGLLQQKMPYQNQASPRQQLLMPASVNLQNQADPRQQQTPALTDKKDKKEEAKQTKKTNKKKKNISYSLGSPVTRSTGIPTDVMRENLIAQFSSMSSFRPSSHSEPSTTQGIDRNNSRNNKNNKKRKIRILDDGSSEGDGRVKRSKIRGAEALVGMDDLFRRRDRLDREMREQMERMDID